MSLHRLGHLAMSQFLTMERGEDRFLSGGLVLFSNCVLLLSWVCTPASLYASCRGHGEAVAAVGTHVLTPPRSEAEAWKAQRRDEEEGPSSSQSPLL